MHRFRLTAVLLVLGLLGAPAAGLYCNDLAESAMSCCTTAPADCGEPRAGADDCCKRVPAGKDSAERSDAAGQRPAVPVLATVHIVPAPEPVAGAVDHPATLVPEPAPVLPTILRL